MKKIIYLLTAGIIILTANACINLEAKGGSCDVIATNGMCYVYGDTYSGIEAETACNTMNGTYGEDSSCTTTSCVGKCLNNVQVQDVTIYYYDPNFDALTTGPQACTNAGGTWSAICP